MERLPGLLAGEPVYWIEDVTALPGGRLGTRLGFSDVAAHPYEDLVIAMIRMLRRVPGVEEVVHEDREVVHVIARGLEPTQIADLVDRFWFERLPSAPIDPGFGTHPAEVLVSPWPSAPPAPVGVPPAVTFDEVSRLQALRSVAALAPSRRRMWTYLAVGAAVLVGGLVLALTPGGGNGVLPLVLGVVNLAAGIRIALRRRQVGAGLF